MLLFGHEQMQVVINAIKELAAEVNKPIIAMPEVVANDALKAAVESACGDALRNAYTIADKMDRYAAIDAPSPQPRHSCVAARPRHSTRPR